jgi:hypothetical protein
MAQSLGPTDPKWGRPARCWRHFNFRFANVSRRVGAWGIQCPKSLEAELVGQLASVRPIGQGLVSYRLKSIVELTQSTYKYPTYPLRLERDQKVGFSFL